MELSGYIASIAMGLILGLLGGGGSILTVPILVYLFAIPPVLATAYSLVIVGATAFVGGFRYHQSGEVDFKTGLIFALPSFAGVSLVRGYVLPRIPEVIELSGGIHLKKPILIMIAFAFLMVAASVSIIRNSFKKQKAASEQMESFSVKKIILIILQGFFVGAIAGFVGAGGGFLIIPALVLLIGLPMRKAIGTSLFIIAANSAIGVLGDLRRGVDYQWSLLLVIGLLAAAGLWLGTKFAHLIPEKFLKRSFGIFVLIMGSFILFDQVSKL